jgi:ribosomal protein S19
MPRSFTSSVKDKCLFYEFEKYSIKKVLRRNIRIRSFMLTLPFRVHDGRVFKELFLNNKAGYLVQNSSLRDLVLTKPIGHVIKKKKGKKR